jgi:hypothetical protein
LSRGCNILSAINGTGRVGVENPLPGIPAVEEPIFIDTPLLEVGVTDDCLIVKFSKKTIQKFRQDNDSAKLILLIDYLEIGWADFMAELCGGKQ